MDHRTLRHRWVPFNVIGVAGAVLQLGLLALLAAAALPVVIATIIAVEAALVHNFLWHERWTWRDRPAASGAERLRRFLKFQGTNGLVSLIGNAIITAALVQSAALPPAAANLVAILACSLINYLSGDRVVFTRTAATVLFLAIGSAASGGQSAPAVKAWDAYVAGVEGRYAPNGDAAEFFALDRMKEARWRDRARAGELPMASLDPPGVPDAKVHHWAGAIYVPNTTVTKVVDRLLDYAGRESEFYEEVKASKLLQRDGDRVRVFLRLYRDAGPVEATYNTEHSVEYRRLGTSAATSRSISTRIAELDAAGTPREREKAPGDDNGFLWRLNAYWRYQQWGDGVLIECESVSLSRGVPFIIRPIASPIVNRIARESLANTLRSLKTFLRR